MHQRNVAKSIADKVIALSNAVSEDEKAAAQRQQEQIKKAHKIRTAAIKLTPEQQWNAMRLAVDSETDTLKVKTILESGFDPNSKDQKTDEPILNVLAAARNTAGIINLLIEAKADPNVSDRAGVTALMRAAKHVIVNEPVMKALVDAKADVTARDKEGKNALAYAEASRMIYRYSDERWRTITKILDISDPVSSAADLRRTL